MQRAGGWIGAGRVMARRDAVVIGSVLTGTVVTQEVISRLWADYLSRTLPAIVIAIDAPEHTPRPRTADSFDEIRAHMRPIAVGTAMCPMNSAMALYDCLRASAKCPSACSKAAEWVGPQEV